MQQSNLYIIGFTIALTIVVGGLLSSASQILGPAQKKSIELDTKTNILSAVMEISKDDDVLGIYDKRIKSLVVNASGQVVDKDKKGNPMIAENVNILKNFKLNVQDRDYPVFKFISATDTTKVEAYIFPVYGNGLWDKIWGFVAMEGNMNEIKGISMSHKAETPGLGQRIDTKEVQNRFVGQQIYNESGEFVSVTMVKGEKGLPLDKHHVDGMSGATLTGNGVNTMLHDYLNAYQPYIKSVSGKSATVGQL